MKHTMLAGAVVLVMSATPALAQNKPAHKAGTAKAHGAMAGDSHFVMNVAMDGTAEVEAAKLATEKAQNPQVKSFGQRMADDHGKANDELKTLAQNKNITLSTTLDPKHKATIDRFTKLSGDAFDRAYMQEMVRDHTKAVNALRMESKSGHDPDVKAWAAKTLPTIEEHLKQAQEVNKTVGHVGTTGTVKKSTKK